MNRTDLQKLSNARIREARILFAAGEYSGAYYLAGYAVECALKACIAKSVKRHDFAKSWTEQSRYSVRTKNEAEAIIDAITRRKDGVLPWIKRRW